MLESTRSHTVRYDLVSEQQEQQQSMRLSSHLFGVLNVFLFTYEMCVDEMYRQKCYMIETNVGRGPPPNLQILARCRKSLKKKEIYFQLNEAKTHFKRYGMQQKQCLEGNLCQETNILGKIQDTEFKR